MAAVVSRRSFLVGVASAAAVSARYASTSAAACASGPKRGSSDAPVFFTPSPVTPSTIKSLEARALRQPSGPIQIGEGLERFLLMRERLARGAIVPPPRATGASRPAIDGDRRVPGVEFDPVTATGSAYDASLAVGPNHVLIVTNFALAVYRKTGGAPVARMDLARWFPNPRPDSVMTFDPRAVFDQFSQRWIVVALAWNARMNPTKSWLLLSVSTTPDPTARWASWIFDARIAGATPTGQYADYPTIAVDAQALYLTMNMMKGGSQTKLRIFPKPPLADGTKTTFVDFVDMPLGVQPCQPYAATTTAYLANTVLSGGVENTLTVWSLTGAPENPQITCRNVTIDPYLTPELAPQKDEAKALWPGDARIRSAVVRANAIWVAFATQYRGDVGVSNAARWYAIPLDPHGTIRKGELSDDGIYYCHPSVLPDTQGNAFMVVSRSSGGEYPSLYQAFWPTTGAASRGVLAPGGGPHLRCRADKPCTPDKDTLNGWGDYNGISADPSDERTIWVAGAIVASPSDKEKWTTWVGALR